MIFKDRKILFVELGFRLKSIIESEDFEELLIKARNNNPWFTGDNVLFALEQIIENFLSEENINSFCEKYSFVDTTKPLNIGIVAAGNIPFVSFHDLMMVVLSGHHACIKLSQNDTVLMQFIIDNLKDLAPEVLITIKDRLNDSDAFIATGSDNSSRYFDYYFGSKPNIIRKNRVSTAVLNGDETQKDLSDFGNDIFRYFGLGCRNVSKMFVPMDYDFNFFFESIEYWNSIIIHHKYRNNYDYNKSIYLVNGENHFDNNFLLLKPDEHLVSPISVLFYEVYSSNDHLNELLNKFQEKTQITVGNKSNMIPFGKSQEPKIDSFADNVDTFEFLINLN